MLNHNLDEFIREARAIPERIVERWREGAVEIGVAGYAALLEKTESTGSVDTGAYRAEHVIQQGNRLVFEHPERVGPDRPLPSQKALGEEPLIGPASLEDVGAALDSGLESGPFRFLNQRFYAQSLEDGTDPPRQIYATAADETEKEADRIARKVEAQPL